MITMIHLDIHKQAKKYTTKIMANFLVRGKSVGTMPFKSFLKHSQVRVLLKLIKRFVKEEILVNFISKINASSYILITKKQQLKILKTR